MLASVRKSERALSLEPGFRVFMATLEVKRSLLSRVLEQK
jgi:hypothetical protein